MLKLFIINTLIVSLAVIVHYEALLRLSIILPKLKLRYRFRIAVGLLGAFMAHVAEVWIFAAAYFLLISTGKFGTIVGDLEFSLMNCAYFSFTTYTTLGYGDVVPFGQIRFLAGLEALTGLVLITWTASFMYLEMQRYWTS
jgi:hypothetical protein